MPPTSRSPSPPPAVELMRRHADAWAERAARGASAAADGDGLAEVVLVDGCAGTEYPHAPAEGPGAVGAAVRLLRGDRRGGVRVVLVEEDPAKVEWLQKALQRHLPGEPLGRVPADGALPGLNLWEADWSACGSLAGLAAEAREVLVLLDPASAAKLPLAPLLSLLRPGRAEVLLRFPAADLRRLARYRGSTLADLPPHARRTVEGVSRLLDDPRHAWAFAWRHALEGEGEEAAVRGVVGTYAERLGLECGRPVRWLALQPEAAPAEHLLLVAGDARGALELNRALFQTRCAGALPWPAEGGDELVRYPPGVELALFGDGAASQGQGRRERVVDRLLLAHSLAERFAGRSPTLEQVLRSVVDTDLLPEDVRQALLDLRRDGRALFRSLASPTVEIAFPRAGGRRPPAPRSRRRGPAPTELTLSFDPAEGDPG